MKETELIAIENGPGALEKRLTRTREGIKLEIAGRVFVELVARAAQGQRAYDAASPQFAEKAFKCAEAFVACWESQP